MAAARDAGPAPPGPSPGATRSPRAPYALPAYRSHESMAFCWILGSSARIRLTRYVWHSLPVWSNRFRWASR
jgi:hypothetical protein